MRLAPAIAATLLASLPPAGASGADDVRALAARKATVIALMHEKAKRALVTAAQDRVFAEISAPTRPRRRRGSRRASTRWRSASRPASRSRRCA